MMFMIWIDITYHKYKYDYVFSRNTSFISMLPMRLRIATMHLQDKI